MDELFSIKDAAVKLAVTESAVRKWIYQRRIPIVKVGRLTRIRQADLAAWVRLGLQPARKDTP